MSAGATSTRPLPVVLVPACNRMLGQHPFHVAGAKYVEAVRLAGALPLVVPDASVQELDALLDLADGVLLTGSPSNVHPSHFGEAVRDTALPLDPARDAWTLPFIPRLIERRLPLLAICRGAQELNVALGGSLHQAVHALPGYVDHRGQGETAESQYAPAHEVRVEPGGLLETVLRDAAFRVNSVHGQAVNRLAPGLRVETRAPDGLVEAFSVQGMDFALGVQWHPEWKARDNPVSMRLLRAFGLACSERAARRHNRQEE